MTPPPVRDHDIDVDALVIGGGIAGCYAALELARKGRSVLILDKTPIRRSGNAGQGIDHWMASPPCAAESDAPELVADLNARTVRGIFSGDEEVADLGIVGAEALVSGHDILLEMESWGIPVRGENGKFRVVRTALGAALWIEAGDLKPKLSEAVARSGAKRAEHVMATDILTGADGRACGVVGFNVRTGAFYTILARTVLVATGWTTRLFHPHFGRSEQDSSFDNVYCPFDTGDGQMAAFRAGAELSNMEFLTLTMTPRDYGTGGVSAFFSAGCRLRNAEGEYFMERYDPERRESTARQVMVRACLEEIAAGRGPIFQDTSLLTGHDLEELRTSWDNEVPILPRYLELKGIEPGRDLLEVVPTVALASGAVHCDTNAMSSVPGLFAAGDCADVLPTGVPGAAIVGRRAGRAMHAFMQEVDTSGEPARGPDRERVEVLRTALYHPMSGKSGNSLPWQEVAGDLRHIMGTYVGVTRNATGIALGRRRLDALLDMEDRMFARDFHELMRVHETRNLIRFGRIMAAASEERRESRFGQSQWQMRSDHPDHTDDEYSFVIARRGDEPDGPPVLERRSPTLPLAAAREFFAYMAGRN